MAMKQRLLCSAWIVLFTWCFHLQNAFDFHHDYYFRFRFALTFANGKLCY